MTNSPVTILSKHFNNLNFNKIFISTNTSISIMSNFGQKNTRKIYCEKCDLILNSRKDFDKHILTHGQIQCEACPLDTIASKISNLFRRQKS